MNNILRPILTKLTDSFQVLSDLHLEVGRQYDSFEIPVAAPYLVLAGDIGRLVDFAEYTSFLQRQVSNFEVVFLVLGNHEFYGLEYTAGLQRARELVCQDCLCGKVILLDKTRHDFTKSNTTILGCTLWSSVPDSDRAMVKSKSNDFKRIEDWTVEAHNAAHASDLDWLQGQVKAIQQAQPKSSRRQIIVITHYPPCKQQTSRPAHVDNAWSSAFATDLLEPYNWPGVKMWIYGHTHYSNDFKVKDIRLIGNQRGYVLNPQASSEKIEGYDVRKVVRLWNYP